MINRKISDKLFEEAKRYFPGGVNSPVRAFKAVDGTPLFIKKGNGSRIVDEDENEFLDFCCSWGPLILGHNNDIVRKAIEDTVSNGITFGTPTKHGNEIGKLIVNNHDYIEKIRFVSSGTEAVMSAIRLARAYTKRDKVIKFDGCYHGHVDSLLVKAGSGLATFTMSSSAGIPQEFINNTIVLPLNDLQLVTDTLKLHANDIAAIIIEPIPANNGLLLQNKEYLEGLRKLCDQYKCLLIFDEVISGFRIGFGGASQYYAIAPDILTFGKIIGGGMPVGAYAASHEIMNYIAPDGPVYQAGTLSANPVAIAAGVATLKQLLLPNFYEDLNQKSTRFVNKIQFYINKKSYPMSIVSIGSIFWLSFASDRIQKSSDIEKSSEEKFRKLHKFLLNHGVYIGPSTYEVGFVSYAHTESDLEQAAEIINQGLDFIHE